MGDLNNYVLFRYSKKTGKIDTTLTGLGRAMLDLWALQNTTKTKNTIVINSDTGAVTYLVEGSEGFPKVSDAKRGADLGICDEYGIPLEALQNI